MPRSQEKRPSAFPANGYDVTTAADQGFPLGSFWQRCWNARRWLMWLPLLICLLPLVYGQGWVAESVLILRHFAPPNAGIKYFFPIVADPTRILTAFPLAVAALTPWPEWSAAALLVATWLLVAGTTYAVTSRLFPENRTAAILAFLLAGTTAYDISLLHAVYVPILITSLLHWSGLLALLVYCEKRSIRWLLGSSLLQIASLLTYATTLPAIFIGPFLALAFIAGTSDFRRALRPFTAIAVAWWTPAICYLGALAWVATQPRNYITGGALTLQSPSGFLWSALKLIAKNFDPIVWLHPHPYFGNPPRIIDPGVVWGLAILATALMVPLVIGASRADAGRVPLRKSRWVLAALFLTIVGSNLATVMVQESQLNLRTHVISRLYAALIIAVLCSTFLRSRKIAFFATGLIVTVPILAVGAWTVADRAAYLTSIWPRHRTELRSLDDLVQRIDRRAAIVLFEPPGAGYTATIVSWHALRWIVFMRGDGSSPPQFAIWSPARKADCGVHGPNLECEGDVQPLTKIPLRQLVLLRYDIGDCRFKLVDNEWVDDSLPYSPPDYAPQAWMLDQPLPSGEYFRRLVYGPQGLGRDFQCQ